jgi:hypothetical protein
MCPPASACCCGASHTCSKRSGVLAHRGEPVEPAPPLGTKCAAPTTARAAHRRCRFPLPPPPPPPHLASLFSWAPPAVADIPRDGRLCGRAGQVHRSPRESHPWRFVGSALHQRRMHASAQNYDCALTRVARARPPPSSVRTPRCASTPHEHTRTRTTCQMLRRTNGPNWRTNALAPAARPGLTRARPTCKPTPSSETLLLI